MSVTPLRTITFTVGDDLNTVTPADEQYAGVQGDNNAAAEVKFNVAALASANPNFLYRIEHVDGSGAFSQTGALPVQDSCVGIILPKEFTLCGGVSTVRLVAYLEDNDGNETQTSRTFDSLIYYRNRDSGSAVLEGGDAS